MGVLKEWGPHAQMENNQNSFHIVSVCLKKMWESAMDAEAGEFPAVSTISGFTGTTYLNLGRFGKHRR